MQIARNHGEEKSNCDTGAVAGTCACDTHVPQLEVQLIMGSYPRVFGALPSCASEIKLQHIIVARVGRTNVVTRNEQHRRVRVGVEKEIKVAVEVEVEV